MVHHHHRYHHLSQKEEESAPPTSQTIILECGNATYKRTRPKLLRLLFFFCLFSCSLVFAPRLFSSSSLPFFYSLGTGNSQEDGLFIASEEKKNAPLCSSIANGDICCDRSGFRSDVCFMRGDVRTQSSASSIFIYSSGDNTDNATIDLQEAEEKIEKIKPYTRKWETSVMDTIDELRLITRNVNDSNLHSCQVCHSVPAVFFSTGGYTGNVYHEFNDGILPLYITSKKFNRQVVFVIFEYHNWWITKYGDILARLSDYPVIDFTHDKTVHCFPEAIVGLRIHDELTVDSSLMPKNQTIQDFRKLLNEAYKPRIRGLIQEEELLMKVSATKEEEKRKLEKRPKLVILSRNGSRAITNERDVVEWADEIGFQVEVLRPTPSTELAKIYRALNSCDVMVGVHGAAMTHFLFMRPGSVFIQVVPLGTDWAAHTYYGEPAMKLGLKYIGYKTLPRESSLYREYKKDDPVLRDPDSVNAKGWQMTKSVYLDGQNVQLDTRRFRKRLVRAYEYSMSKWGRWRDHLQQW